jgi:hypothetical protein
VYVKSTLDQLRKGHYHIISTAFSAQTSANQVKQGTLHHVYSQGSLAVSMKHRVHWILVREETAEAGRWVVNGGR